MHPLGAAVFLVFSDTGNATSIQKSPARDLVLGFASNRHHFVVEIGSLTKVRLAGERIPGSELCVELLGTLNDWVPRLNGANQVQL